MDNLPKDLPLPLSRKMYGLINATCKLTRDDWKVWCLRPGAGNADIAGHFLLAERLLEQNLENGGRAENDGWRIGYFLPKSVEEVAKAIISGRPIEDLSAVA